MFWQETSKLENFDIDLYLDEIEDIYGMSKSEYLKLTISEQQSFLRKNEWGQIEYLKLYIENLKEKRGGQSG